MKSYGQIDFWVTDVEVVSLTSSIWWTSTEYIKWWGPKWLNNLDKAVQPSSSWTGIQHWQHVFRASAFNLDSQFNLFKVAMLVIMHREIQSLLLVRWCSGVVNILRQDFVESPWWPEFKTTVSFKKCSLTLTLIC